LAHINFYNCDNMTYKDNHKYNLIYCDYIYQNKDFSWVDKYWEFLKETGIFIVQTDDSTQAEIKLYLDNISGGRDHWVNTLIYKMEWGGTPSKGFPQKHDYIHVYCKNNKKEYTWNKEPIQIPKVTAGTKFDKKGTGLKTPCSVFDDLGNFSTMSKERVKNNNGRNIQWQKPMKLMNRLFLAFTNEDDWILDPFMGSGTSAMWCQQNNRNFIGIEYDEEVFKIALKRFAEGFDDN